jgi:hypothetical protein
MRCIAMYNALHFHGATSSLSVRQSVSGSVNLKYGAADTQLPKHEFINSIKLVLLTSSFLNNMLYVCGNTVVVPGQSCKSTLATQATT